MTFKMPDSIIDMFVSNVSLPTYNYIKKDGSLKYVHEITKFNQMDNESILKHQLSRIRYIAEYAYKNTKYYKSVFDKIGIKNPQHLTWDDYHRIPVITKETIRTEKHALISACMHEEQLRKTATGGTTSSPTPFYSDWDSTFRKRSATSVFDGWLGFKPGMKSAYLWGAFQDFVDAKSFKEKAMNSLVHRRIYLPGSPLDDDILERYYRQVKAFMPYLLQSYPTPLEIFADFIQRKSYKLDIPALSCTAEPLLDHQKDLVLKVFGKSPYNWYGAREAGRIATECGYHDGMHINSYCLRLDIVSSSFAVDGLGSIVLTDLWNTGMPLIRYEIGDIGRVTEKSCRCGCHLPRLMEMLGRVTDTFVNSKGQKIPGIGFTNRYIKDAREICGMQIIQHGIKDFEVLVVPTDGFNSETVAWLGEKLNEFMLEPTTLRVTKVPEIAREKSGKIRFCKNLMPETS